MRVVIHGPNLSGSAQAKGYFHVHSAECADNRKYGPGKPMGGEDRGYTMEITSAVEACEFIYADHISDYGLTDTKDPEAVKLFEDWLNDFYFAPCIPKGF